MLWYWSHYETSVGILLQFSADRGVLRLSTYTGCAGLKIAVMVTAEDSYFVLDGSDLPTERHTAPQKWSVQCSFLTCTTRSA